MACGAGQGGRGSVALGVGVGGGGWGNVSSDGRCRACKRCRSRLIGGAGLLFVGRLVVRAFRWPGLLGTGRCGPVADKRALSDLFSDQKTPLSDLREQITVPLPKECQNEITRYRKRDSTPSSEHLCYLVLSRCYLVFWRGGGVP